MRVSTDSIYYSAQSRVDTLLTELDDANTEVSTGLKINKLSDDPVGLSQVMSLRSGLSNLSQLSTNISTAQNWLSSGESALQSIGNQLDSLKTTTLAMANGTMTAEDRANAADQVTQTLNQVLDLANTQVNGQYIFSGTDLTTKPYTADNASDPTTVTYSGNDGAFTVQTGKDTTMTVGYSGEDIFGSQQLTVDDTNDKIDFEENVGGGYSTQLTATIPSGTYTRGELATAIGNAMTTASANGVTYTVSDTNNEFTINGSSASLTGLKLLWGDGTNAGQSIASDIGFGSTDTTTLTTGTTTKTASVTSDAVQWGLFKTLFDLKNYLTNNDTAGIERSLTRLDTQYNNMTDAVSRIGYKQDSLTAKTTVIQDLTLSYQTQKSSLEDADMVTAISNLQAKQTAYQAALQSTAMVMKISLLNYM